MYYIDDYKKQAINKILPYLIEFPQIVSVVENSANRYQAIEDVLWNIANNFKLQDSRGIFLKAHANNEVTDIIYTDKAQDAFTYGTENPLYQAYGKGHYYSQASYISGIRKTLTDDKTIRAVQAKIIQNNTDCTIEDLIEALKLLYNCEKAKVYESNFLSVNIELVGSDIELSSSGNYENIKKLLPACVKLNGLYVNPKTFDIFDYSQNSSYGDSRYIVKVSDTTDIYQYISKAINLNSANQEYIKKEFQMVEPDRTTFIVDNFEILPAEIINGGNALTSSAGTLDGLNATDTSTDVKSGLNATTLNTLNISNDGIFTYGHVKSLINRSFSYYSGNSWEFSTKIKMKQYLGKNKTSVVSSKFFNTNIIGLYTHPSYEYAYFFSRNDKNVLFKDFTNKVACYAGNEYFIKFGWDKVSQRLYLKLSEDNNIWEEESILLPLEEIKNVDFVFEPSVLSEMDIEWMDLKYTAFSINNKEIFNANKNRSGYFDNNSFYYISGTPTSIKENSTFISCNDIEDNIKMSFGIKNNKLALTYNNTVHATNIPVEINKNYSFALAIVDGTLKVWTIEGIRINGKNINNDISYINNVIFNKSPLIEISNVGDIKSNVYINCLNTENGNTNFGDFTYYVIIDGRLDTDTKTANCTEYYATCYGEKHILINCLEDKNHLSINTNDTRSHNLTTKQSYFNYKYNHSGNRYAYFDGNSKVEYNVHNATVLANNLNFDISFDFAPLVKIKEGVILSNFIGSNSKIGINENEQLYFSCDNHEIILTEFDDCKMHNFKLTLIDNELTLYIDKEIREQYDFTYTINNIPSTLNVGYGDLYGILRNLTLIISNENDLYEDLEIPFTHTLKDTTKEIEYVNNGIRFINMPQLISETNNIDIYGNKTQERIAGV